LLRLGEIAGLVMLKGERQGFCNRCHDFYA
jgi:hypothetical protein